MISKELLDKVHRIEITTSRMVTDVFAGQYHSQSSHYDSRYFKELGYRQAGREFLH